MKGMKRLSVMFSEKEQIRHRSHHWFRRSLVALALAALSLASPQAASADVVTDWNQITLNTIKSANASSVATLRALAITQAAVFDAVNGVARRYAPYHVTSAAPRGASRRAAAIQAAYAVLVQLFPSQQAQLDAERSSSLAAITDDGNFEDSQSIARGINWGQQVADEILAWRSTDGSNAVYPPFTGNNMCGQWRPTPSVFAPAAMQQLAYMTPFALLSPSQFRPAGPRPLWSVQYATDFNEVKALGSANSTVRTAEQTEIAKFWGDNVQLHWNRIALTVAATRHDQLVDNARLFALLNLAMSDANIAAWDAKYFYNHWRPITAIREAGCDNNPATEPDPSWTPLSTTPNHQEYTSGHSTLSSAAARVLASFFGDNVTFTHASDSLPGVMRTHASFSAAANEASESRIYSGVHFRSTANDGQPLGAATGDYVLANVARSDH